MVSHQYHAVENVRTAAVDNHRPRPGCIRSGPCVNALTCTRERPGRYGRIVWRFIGVLRLIPWVGCYGYGYPADQQSTP